MPRPPAARRTTRRLRALLAVSVALLAGAAPAWAHGGEDHGAAAPAASGAGVFTTAAMTPRFEVVLKHAPVRGGEPYVGTLYLADFPTNRPVSGATVTMAEPGVTARPFQVEATDEPGVYAVTREGGFPRDGHYDVTVSVSAGSVSDLVLLSGLSIGPAAAPVVPVAAPTGGASRVPWPWVLGVMAAAAGLALFLVRSARQRRRSPAPGSPAPGSPVPADPSLADPASPVRRPESEPSLS